jgi:hypothetical protein
MPRQKPAERELPPSVKNVLEQLVTGPMGPVEAQELARSFKKALYERILGAELSHHLGYKPGEARPRLCEAPRTSKDRMPPPLQESGPECGPGGPGGVEDFAKGCTPPPLQESGSGCGHGGPLEAVRTGGPGAASAASFDN